MAKVLIAGGSGLVGTKLSRMLKEKGYEVFILTRKVKPNNEYSQCLWNPAGGTIDTAVLGMVDYVINLSGAGVADKRWSKKRKQEIVDSRVLSGQLIAKALSEVPNKVQAVIQASAMGWYGDDRLLRKGAVSFVEDDPAATDFFGETCEAWENSIKPVASIGKRLVILRIGLVLSRSEGAFTEFAKPVRLGIAGILGSGKQIQSWIHDTDLCRMFVYALENNITGVYNAVAPAPVSNKELVTQIAQSIKGAFYIPVYVPSFLLTVLVGEVSRELQKSITVSCEKIKKQGFQYVFPTVEAAVKELTT